MNIEEFKIEKYPQEIAEKLYNLQLDMDWMDYEEEKEQIVNDLENAIYYLKSVCENEYNANYFRTFYKILENI